MPRYREHFYAENSEDDVNNNNEHNNNKNENKIEATDRQNFIPEQDTPSLTHYHRARFPPCAAPVPLRSVPGAPVDDAHASSAARL